LNIDEDESRENHESSIEDDEEMVDDNDAEYCDPDEETVIQTTGRRKGRPALLKTGKLSRSRKVY